MVKGVFVQDSVYMGDSRGGSRGSQRGGGNSLWGYIGVPRGLLWVLRMFCRGEFEGAIDEEDLVDSMQILGIPNFEYISASH